MRTSLPPSVVTFFELSNGREGGTIEQCFSADATVSDERRTHRGVEAIGVWLREARAAFDYSVEPLDAQIHDGQLGVLARVVGNFPGSPVELAHDFRLAADGRIEQLDIH